MQVKSAYDCYLGLIASTLLSLYTGPREWSLQGPAEGRSWESMRAGVRGLVPEGDHNDAL